MTFDAEQIGSSVDTRNQKRFSRISNKRWNHKETESRGVKREVRLGQFYNAIPKEALERHEEVARAHQRKLQQIAKLQREHVVPAQPAVLEPAPRRICQLRMPQPGGTLIFLTKEQASAYFAYLKSVFNLE